MEIAIEVNLFYELEDMSVFRGEEGKHIIFIAEKSTIFDLIYKLGLSQTNNLNIIVNGKTVSKEAILHDRDIVCLFPLN